MNFGSIFGDQSIKLDLPELNSENLSFLELSASSSNGFTKSIGSTSWSKASMKNFYSKGEKNALTYYSTMFNSIELNAFYYRIFPPNIINNWVENTSSGFKFYPKIPRMLSGVGRFRNYQNRWDDCIHAFRAFNQKLGIILLQLSSSFGYENLKGLEQFLISWPEDLSLAIEFRNEDLFKSSQYLDYLQHLLADHKVIWVITDTPGRRDVLHMRLTTNQVFIRFNAIENPSIDQIRMNDWLKRLSIWKSAGLEHCAFFVHEHTEVYGPRNSLYFSNKMHSLL
jgi:uncharacterized protein YecE (DUF72 family)